MDAVQYKHNSDITLVFFFFLCVATVQLQGFFSSF